MIVRKEMKEGDGAVERDNVEALVHHVLVRPPEEVLDTLHYEYDKAGRHSLVKMHNESHEQFEARQRKVHSHHTKHDHDPHYMQGIHHRGTVHDQRMSELAEEGSSSLRGDETVNIDDDDENSSYYSYNVDLNVIPDTSWIKGSSISTSSRNDNDNNDNNNNNKSSTTPNYVSSSTRVSQQQLKLLPPDDEIDRIRKTLSKLSVPKARVIQGDEGTDDGSTTSNMTGSVSSHSSKSASGRIKSPRELAKKKREDAATRKSEKIERKLPPINESHTMNNSLLGSAEERESDLWQYDFESWCSFRKITPALKVTLKDKVSLRNWFAALDEDGSGEVSIDELENPMISAGILKTHDEVRKCFAMWDKDGSNTISFDEFVDALSGNEFVDKGKLDQLRNYSHDSTFTMDTLLMAERRKNIKKFVINESIDRSKKCEDVAKNMLHAAHNIVGVEGNENHSAERQEHLFKDASRKFDEMEHDISVRMIQTDVYLNDLTIVVQRSRDVYNAVDYLSNTNRHFKKSNDKEDKVIYQGVLIPDMRRPGIHNEVNKIRSFIEYKPLNHDTDKKRRALSGSNPSNSKKMEESLFSSKDKRDQFEKEVEQLKQKILAGVGDE